MSKIRLVRPETLNLHPQAALVPQMPKDQYAAFLADVKERNVIDKPIELIPGTTCVIDGRTRLRAALDAGLGIVPVVDADLGDDTPVVYMLRTAVLRRQLTSSQAAAVAVELKKQLAAAAKERQKAGASRGGRTAKDKVPEIVPGASGKPKDRSGEAREQAARIAGTNPRYVSDAEKVQQKAPELFEQLKAGEVTLPEATRAVKAREKPAAVPEPPGPAVKVVEPPALNPCPFCGSTRVELVSLALYVVCRDCHACGPAPASAAGKDARAAWNKRAKVQLTAPEPYGWFITYTTNRGEELSCHYVGTEAACRKKALMRPCAEKILAAEGLTEEQYVRAYGRGRM